MTDGVMHYSRHEKARVRIGLTKMLHLTVWPTLQFEWDGSSTVVTSSEKPK